MQVANESGGRKRILNFKEVKEKKSVVVLEPEVVKANAITALTLQLEQARTENRKTKIRSRLAKWEATVVPEKKVFNVDIGEMPVEKAKEVLSNLIEERRN